MSAKKKRKGRFGLGGFRVSKRVVFPERRRWQLPLAAGAVLAVLLAFGLDLRSGGGRVVTGGPLSSSHATLDRDCAACHVGGETPATACSVCHEKLGDRLGAYTWNAHYLYVSEDFRRLVPAVGETACSGCHGEHEGRDGELTRVGDDRCLACHEGAGFADGHPDFAALSDETPDPGGLAFPHAGHVAELMRQRGFADLERACLECHVPDREQRGFGPISFERHCAACHLTAGVATPRLPLATAETPGVESLEAIRASGRPGSDWAWRTSPRDFRAVRDLVMKSPVRHEDPWILDNLRRLRGSITADRGLADLLRTSPDVPPSEVRALYVEAVDHLEELAAALRPRPEAEVQAELVEIEALLAAVRDRLADPFTPLDETAFLLDEVRREDAPAERVAAVEELIGQLMAPCLQCHRLEEHRIVRVRADQGQYRRAVFDHRAHILQARCLDCHAGIPVADLIAEPELPMAESERDHAGLLNLPSIAVCRSCHTPELASTTCRTCHRFHPERPRRGEMLLYVEDAAEPPRAGHVGDDGEPAPVASLLRGADPRRTGDHARPEAFRPSSASGGEPAALLGG